MPLESLYQCGLLLTAIVVAFAISSVVGVVIASVWASSRPLGDAADD
jgi:multisubunit Na+/H+ antiporter MnhC subunit